MRLQMRIDGLRFFCAHCETVERNFFKNNRLRALHVIDKNPRVAADAASILKSDATLPYRSVADFCRENHKVGRSGPPTLPSRSKAA